LGTPTGTEKGLKVLEKILDELKETFEWFEKGNERTLLIQNENIDFAVRFMSYIDYIIPEERLLLLKDKYEQLRFPRSIYSLSKQVGDEIDYYFKKGAESQRQLFDKLNELYRLGELATTVNDIELENRIFGLLDSKIELIASVDPQTGRMLRDHFFPERGRGND
jgi:hypothetical protein